MAGLGGKNWTFQEEVTSSDVNGYLADQVVMRFADSTARTAGFGGSGEPTLAEGMISYLDDANRVEVYNGSAWKPVSQVLQVVQTVKTDTFVSSAVATPNIVDVTGLTASITPSSTSSKILVLVNLSGTISDSVYGGRTILGMNVYRDSTQIGQGAAAGNRTRITAQGGLQINYQGMTNLSTTILDSPNTTNAITYKVSLAHVMSDNVTCTLYVNRTYSDTDNDDNPRTASFITLMEVVG